MVYNPVNGKGNNWHALGWAPDQVLVVAVDQTTILKVFQISIMIHCNFWFGLVK